MSAKMTV